MNFLLSNRGSSQSSIFVSNFQEQFLFLKKRQVFLMKASKQMETRAHSLKRHDLVLMRA